VAGPLAKRFLSVSVSVIRAQNDSCSVVRIWRGRRLTIQKSDLIGRSLDARTVQEALLQVDPKYRVTLDFFYLGNLSYREIVDVLGIPIGTVMPRLSKGKAQLKSILSDKSLWRW
jgi:DNA-directed RNA polymerase specialized sigma24 family protein